MNDISKVTSIDNNRHPIALQKLKECMEVKNWSKQKIQALAWETFLFCKNFILFESASIVSFSEK
jgi:hypothetical protein